ncbi:MAG: putative protease [Caudoviricetes sp.]|nr:MAG: putative protease [Caudoviricetes sp.]
MKYCLDYKKYGKYMDSADELNINFRREDTSLFDFLSERKHQRVNISIPDQEDFLENNDIEIFRAMVEKDSELNFVIKLEDYHSDTTKKIYKQIRGEFKYFFSTFVRDWDTLLGYVSLKPTDIYVVENLCFELDKVARILHSWDIHVRAFPNVAQSSWYNTKDLKKFFIRPDDIDFYGNYIDTVEFMGPRDSIGTYYKIYAIDKKWFGKLNEIIIDFNSELDSRHILPHFAEMRVKCRKRCFKGGTCRVCEAIESTSKTLENNGMIIEKVKNNNSND